MTVKHENEQIHDRTQMREFFSAAWQKREHPDLLSPLERQLLSIIEAHKEYECVFEDPDFLQNDYRTDNNPFLHMSLHLGVIEQLTTNRPAGIRELYQKAYRRWGNEHDAQHVFMEVMAEIIFEASQKNELPNESVYLERIRLKVG